LVNSGSNSNSEQDWEAQLADYSFGVMEPGAAVEFERGLNECRAHVILSQQYAEVASALGLAASPAEPPAGHKGRFLARLVATPQEGAGVIPAAAAPMPLPVRRETAETVGSAAPSGDGQPQARVTGIGEYREKRSAPAAWQAVASVAAALLLFIAGFGWYAADRARQEAEAQVAALERARTEFAETLNIPPDWWAFPVRSTETQPKSWAVCLINPKSNQAFLMTKDLSPLTEAQMYELWWLPKDESQPVAAGKFNTDAQGRKRIEATAPQDLSNYSGVAVTLEPNPDPDPAPSGVVVLAGTYDVP
jgi:anti-sigma-K factor RskA